MITKLATVETDTVADFLKLFKRIGGEFKQTFAGVAPTLIAGARYSLPHFNVHQETIVASDGTAVVSYRPVEGDRVVSEVVFAAPLTAGATLSYTANTASFKTREVPNQRAETPMEAPRLYILHNQSIPIAYRKQVNDAGKRVVARKLFMMILVDTDDKVGKEADSTGPLLKNKLIGLAQQLLSRPENLLWLFENGYENIKLQDVNFFSPEDERVIGVYRGMLMISADIFPEPF